MNSDLLKNEFPLAEDLIYLNHAAVAPWPARTRDAVRRFAGEISSTGAQNYMNWMKKETELRGQIQRLLNAPTTADIALMKNTSEALSVVAAGLPWQAGDNIVTSDQEFPSNRIPWQALADRDVHLKEVDIRVAEPEQALLDNCDGHTRVLTISSVQYGSGIRLDLEVLGRYCRQHDILFCVDGIQSLGAITMDVQTIKADFVMADAHKWLLGPEGVALFYSTPAARDKLQLHEFGWHMVENVDFNVREWQPARSARRFECGSPNMVGIYAMSASLSLLEEAGYRQVDDMVLDNSAYLIERLDQIDAVRILTPRERQHHAGIISFTVDGTDLDRLHGKLAAENILCVHRGGGIRFSPHFYIGRDKLDRAIEVLSESI